jgi:hypothetical protein
MNFVEWLFNDDEEKSAENFAEAVAELHPEGIKRSREDFENGFKRGYIKAWNHVRGGYNMRRGKGTQND